MIIACVALSGAVGLAIVAALAASQQVLNSINTNSGFRELRAQDGDTLKTRNGAHIRLLCIDAPEQDQPGGPAAQKALKSLVARGAKIQGRGKDSYGRTLGIAFSLGDDSRKSINTAMIRMGHAWVYRRFASDCGIPRRELCQAEHEARSAQMGLWGEAHPVPPWQWRQGKIRPPNRFPPCEKRKNAETPQLRRDTSAAIFPFCAIMAVNMKSVCAVSEVIAKTLSLFALARLIPDEAAAVRFIEKWR